MTDLERLLQDYIAEHRAGGQANPRDYLDPLEGADREALAALIDAYLARSPGQPWDEEAYAGSAAERLVESLKESLAGASGSWPVLLPELRHRAQVKREQLVERLAAALGVTGRDKQEKVAHYYNQMEHGRLRPDGVSDKVLDALAAIDGTTRDALRKAGRMVAPPDADEAVFARMAVPREEYLADAGTAASGAPADAAREPEHDEVDELFLGG